MNTKRKIHSANFKAKVALAACKADKTSAELISTHKVTSGQISTWKKQCVDNKTDFNDAATIHGAVTRLNKRVVAIKTVEQQDTDISQ